MFTFTDRIELALEPPEFPEIVPLGVVGYHRTLFVNVDSVTEENGTFEHRLPALYGTLHQMPAWQVVLVSSDLNPVVFWHAVKRSSLHHRFRDVLLARSQDPAKRADFIKGYAIKHDLHTYVAVEPHDECFADRPSWIFTTPRDTGLSSGHADVLVNLLTRFEIGYPRP